MLTPRNAAIAVILIAAAAIIGAWNLEFAGYSPCPLCLQQRWAYYALIPLAAIAAGVAPIRRPLLGLMVLIGIASMIFGVYHSGVEWKWWPGPGTCGGSLDAGTLLPSLDNTPVISCEDAAIRIFGLSLAGWNAVISLAMAMIAAMGFKNYGSSSVSQ
ncbi:MAG: disulfide bond formation protein B [Rhizobiales bacterium]|nr:disulfide bond formation protein B [Hyphomicrobiales bacterium]